VLGLDDFVQYVAHGQGLYVCVTPWRVGR
jgi:hypothetical protein